MDKKIIQKLEDLAARIRFGNYLVKFVISKGKIEKIILKETEEVVLSDRGFDKSDER